MDDLISRQAAIDKFEPWLKVEGYGEGELNMLKAVLYELRFLPSAQPEIIRCKECLMHCVCKFEQGLGLDGYCSQAKRRTDGSD